MSKGRVAALERIRHILDAVAKVGDYVARGRPAFDAESSIRDAILYQIVIIGEAAKATIAADPSIATEIREVEWSLLARMRDRITHHYWGTDYEIVWSTATIHVPTPGRDLGAAMLRLE